MRVGEDGWKAREMPSHGATMHNSLRAPLSSQGMVMGYISLDGGQWATEHQSQLACCGKQPGGMEWYGGVPPCPGIVSSSISRPFLGDGAPWLGQSPNVAEVLEKPLSPRQCDLRG